MKKVIVPTLLLMLTLTSLTRCSKGGGGNGGCSETGIQVSTTPAVNTTDPPAPGPDFPLEVNITSGFPAAGATIEVRANVDGNSTPFFTANPNATAGVNNITITNTPVSTSCVVNITVISKSCNTNKWTGSYRYSRK